MLNSPRTAIGSQCNFFSDGVAWLYYDNILVVHCTQDVILYTDKGRLDAVVWLIRRLFGHAEITLRHVSRQSRGNNTLYCLRQVWQIGHRSVVVQCVLI